MNFLNSLNNVVDQFFDYIDPLVPNTLSPDYAAFVIQKNYRKHLIRKYFKHMKYCGDSIETSKTEIKKGWFS